MTASTSFELLHQRIKHFIWAQGWEQLRDVQERAIPHIVAGDRDVVIAAQTAAGKTEAAFLPALTRLLQADSNGLIVYVSPLKALINDQFGRLEQLCQDLEIPVWPWHGDVPVSKKQRFIKKPAGVLLITPESLEATLCNRGTSVGSIFSGVQYFIVDELHAFIGTERGKQLQSLLHRIERAIGRKVVRIGLSATLGDMRLAAEYLRPTAGKQVELVVAPSEGTGLKMLVKGYVEPAVARRSITKDAMESQDDEDEPEQQAPAHVALHLYKVLRGTNNLVFPNSRAEVERYTKLLNDLCDRQQTPKEFWPHHGSLSKELRSETEEALKRKDQPASAVCTNTLELGIDIGAVKSVAQVGSPFSVASLRQRLGRSGRRAGESKILRGYVIEKELNAQSRLFDTLRIETVQMAAMIELLLQDWFEPPPANGLHLSTLVQQLLSLIAQRGGVTAQESYAELCGRGAPFQGLTVAEYAVFLRHLAGQELVMQDSSGDLLHGRLGERLVNHYDFYAAFAADDEYRIIADGRLLGTIPVNQLVQVGQRLLFGGNTWIVQAVEEEQHAIYVTRARGGVAPKFNGGGGRIHTAVRRKMRELLACDGALRFLDPTAQRLLDEGRATYRALRLDETWYVNGGTHLMLMTWMGDSGNQALARMLASCGYDAWVDEVAVTIGGRAGLSVTEVITSLRSYAGGELPPATELLANAKNLAREKWDWALPPELLQRGYASFHLDLEEATQWVRQALSRLDEATLAA